MNINSIMETRIYPKKGNTYIYGIIDPRTNQLRYVGKTKVRLDMRLASHFRITNIDHRGNWFANMRKNNVQPDIFKIEEVENWREAERFWIAYFRSIGCKLVNKTFGGDGLSGANVTSFKLGQKAWNKGKKYSVKTRKKISEAGKRRIHLPWTKEMRERHRETMRRVCNVEPSRKARAENNFKQNPRGQRKRKRTGAARDE